MVKEINTTNDLNLKIEGENKQVLVNESCCTCINVILKNDGQIMTSFLGAHNPEILNLLEKAQKAYFKEIKRTLKRKYKETSCGCDDKCTCGDDCNCTPDNHCGCGGHCHEEKHDCGCGHNHKDTCCCTEESKHECTCENHKEKKPTTKAKKSTSNKNSTKSSK